MQSAKAFRRTWAISKVVLKVLLVKLTKVRKLSLLILAAFLNIGKFSLTAFKNRLFEEICF